MSKRYGRNQKRRAREQIATLEKNKAQLITSRGRAFAELGKAREEIARAKEAAIPFCGLFEPELVEEPDHHEGDSFRLASVDRFDLSSLSEAESYVSQAIPLDVLYAHLDEDRLKDVMHCELRFRGQRLGYAMTAGMLKSLPRGYVQHLLQTEIARLLASEFVRRFGPPASGRF